MEAISTASPTDPELMWRRDELEVSVNAPRESATATRLLEEWALVFDALREFLVLVEDYDRRSNN